MENTPLNIILKVTRRCNLRCEYCHDLADDSRAMPFEVLASLTERFLARRRVGKIRFIWHGGEPLLLGQDFFRKAVALQREFARPGQEIVNNIQTNGLLLDDPFADLLGGLGFTFGVSLDGPEALHDAQRSDRSGRPTFAQVVAAIERLRSRKLPFGVITVLTRRSVATPPEELLSFYSDSGIKDVCFLAVRSDCHLVGETLPEVVFGDYMRRLFDAWLRLNDPELRIREFGNWMLLAMGFPGNTCSSAGSCVGSTFSVESDGTVCHCDKFAQEDKYRYGPVEDLDFDTLPDSSACRSLRKMDLDLPLHCMGCPYRKYCAGGCGHDRFLEQAAGARDDRCSLREILTHVKGRIEGHPKVRELMESARGREVLL